MRAPHQPGQRRAWSAFALIAGIVLLALFASATPSPLYADYAARWHFSTPMLTVVFAAYALGALTALLLAGRLSDDLGRRPLLTAGLAGLLGAMLLYAFARSVEWPLAARLVQGVATGIILSTAGAALLELEPGRGYRSSRPCQRGQRCARDRHPRACLLATRAGRPGSPGHSIRAAVCSLSLRSVVWPCFPSPWSVRHAPSLRPQRPVVPAEVRSAFALASAGVVSSWSIAGLYLALAPSLAPILLHTGSHLAGGVSVFAPGVSAGLGQVAFRSLTPSQATAAGALVLAAGMAVTVASIPADSGALFLVGSVITGAGWGSRSWARSARSPLRHPPSTAPA